MAEVLSQSQIDALLKEMGGGASKEEEKQEEKEEIQYHKYDFYSPKKISRDKIKLLKGIYDNYSRMASSRLNGLLRINCEIEAMAVEEQRFREFYISLNENDIMMTQTVELPNESKNPPILYHMTPGTMVAMIDRLLGGTGEDLDDIDSNYAYTDIELELYQKIMGYFLDFTYDAWSGYIKMKPGVHAIEQNPSLFQDISLDETVAIIMLSIAIGSTQGSMTICIPRALLTEFFIVIDSKKNFAKEEIDLEESRKTILSKIKKSVLPVTAGLEQVEVSIRDVHDLKVGDVIDLGQAEGSEVYLSVGDTKWMKGTLGTYKKNVAVLIDGRVDEDKETSAVE